MDTVCLKAHRRGVKALEQLTARGSGEFAIATYVQARALLKSESRAVGSGCLVIELSGLTFIDASGVTANVRTHNWAQRRE